MLELLNKITSICSNIKSIFSKENNQTINHTYNNANIINNYYMYTGSTNYKKKHKKSKFNTYIYTAKYCIYNTINFLFFIIDAYFLWKCIQYIRYKFFILFAILFIFLLTINVKNLIVKRDPKLFLSCCIIIINMLPIILINLFSKP